MPGCALGTKLTLLEQQVEQVYCEAEKSSVDSSEMTPTELFADVERFGLLQVQIVVLEVAVVVVVAAGYKKLVPVVL